MGFVPLYRVNVKIMKTSDVNYPACGIYSINNGYHYYLWECEMFVLHSFIHALQQTIPDSLFL